MKPPRPDAEGAKRGEPSSPRGPIAGVVLAGGEGRRLGGTKAVLRLPGSQAGESGPTLVDWAVTRLAAVAAAEEILVAAGNSGTEVDPVDRRVPVLLAGDGPGSGPAAGVLGAARARPGRNLLVLACDLPLVPMDLLTELAASNAELAAAATDPGDARSMNPTCALWTPRALQVLATRVERGDYRLYPVTRCADLQVEPVDAGRFGDPGSVLLNVNTAADWERARRLVER